MDEVVVSQSLSADDKAREEFVGERVKVFAVELSV